MFSGIVDPFFFLQKTSTILQVRWQPWHGTRNRRPWGKLDRGEGRYGRRIWHGADIGTTKVNSERELNMANESGNTDIETGVILGQEPGQVAVAATSSVDRGKKGKATRNIEEMEGFVQHRYDEAQSYLAKDKPTLQARSSKITDTSVTIYRVPEAMRLSGEKESLYKPTCIDVYYPLLKGDDDHYYFHLYSILQKNNNKGLKDYLLMMEEQKEEIAKRNEEHISIDFSHLFDLLLSSCFILDLFLKYFDGKLSPADDPECGHRWVNDLWVDLLLVENQIPFFILEKVYEMAYSESTRTHLEVIAFYFFDQFVPMNWEKFDQFVLMNWRKFRGEPSEVYHLLHLVHESLIPSDPGRHKRLKRKNCILYSVWGTLFEWLGTPMQLPMDSERLYRLSRMRTIPTATTLQQAGVKFRPREDRGFVVEFNNGVLELPHLHVGTTTKKFLMNLIAWEQCHPGDEKYFTNYAIFLDYLINTSKDIEILIESGVLEHSLKNNEEVVQVFNSLSDNLVYTKLESYDFLRKELNHYCGRRFNKWWARLMIDYFGSPWTTISLIAAAIIVLLTMLQSFFSVYSYFRPPQQK
ncbi:UPF0481 protein At3g47200-like [Aristolochia californica]|uniref:UPF0481 protein At3g47200-like n=1 Tax=Aristolochia californica TaxID=171875 RepID=UPI0035DDF11C